MGFEKIFVALDSSDASQAVFSAALELAKFKGAALMLYHCLGHDRLAESMASIPVELGLSPELLDPSFQIVYESIEEQVQEARGMLSQYCQTAIARGVAAEFDVGIGAAGECIRQAAKAWGADTIAIGRRGRTGLAEAILGSVSNYVVHHAPCWVLVIPLAGELAV